MAGRGQRGSRHPARRQNFNITSPVEEAGVKLRRRFGFLLPDTRGVVRGHLPPESHSLRTKRKNGNRAAQERIRRIGIECPDRRPIVSFSEEVPGPLFKAGENRRHHINMDDVRWRDSHQDIQSFHHWRTFLTASGRSNWFSDIMMSC